MKPFVSRLSLLTLAVLAWLPGRSGLAQTAVAELNGWPVWGGNLSNTHSSSADRYLRKENASQLTLKWTFMTGGNVSATPTVEDHALYIPDWAGNLFKIDTLTGKAIWSHRIFEYTGRAKSRSRSSPAIASDVIVLGDQTSGIVFAVDKKTGSLVWKTVVDPHPFACITASIMIYGNYAYAGVSSAEEAMASRRGYNLSFRGSVVALDLSTGTIKWRFHTIPEGYTGGPVWGSGFAVDPKRGSLYATSGNNYSVPATVSSCLSRVSGVQAQLSCLDPGDFVDSIFSLDLKTGSVKWGRRLQGADTWNFSCRTKATASVACPDPAGPDYDFGSGPNLFTTLIHGKPNDLIGAGQKSGVYWALNPDDGSTIWSTQVGPGGPTGGIQWGSATDPEHIYVAVSNSANKPFTLAKSSQTWNGGAWAALEPSTGEILWQIPATGKDPTDPSLPAGAYGQVSAAGGVMFAGSYSGDMVAIEGSTGKILWSFASGGSIICGPSIVNGSVYWGSGYSPLHNNKLYAFTVEPLPQ